MKKLFLLSIIAVFAINNIGAQGQLKGGVNLGLPVGDAGDFATFSIAVDLGYLFEISETFDAGVITGFSHSFGDEIGGFEIDDIQFLPLAAAGRLSVSDKFAVGTDLGYAVGINEGNDGGFYYAPRAQYSLSESLDLVLAYRGVSRDGGSFDVLTLGIEFEL